jgi:NADH-quinone oxidoreductase subunit M
MELGQNYLLTLFSFPLIATLLVPFVPKKWNDQASIALSVIYFIIALFGFKAGEIRWSAEWFQELKYGLYLDSYSYFLILLSAFLTVICLFYSHKVVKTKIAAYNALFHALQATVVACLLCDDLVFFYIFWEAMLIPMYFIIGIWGGPRRLYATMKFFLFTFAGSLLMLVGLVSTYVLYFQQTGEWTASFQTLLAYFGFVVSFAIRVPFFPFHTWLPDAHVEAPTAGSVILAGVLLKMGTYGLMRFAVPLFPEAAVFYSTPLVAISVIGILLGALIAWQQTDIKKLIAYSSVSHLGFVTLGIFMMTEMGWSGAYLQMINHGISTGALFLLVGFLYDQTHSRDINAYGGIAKILPLYTLVLLVVTLSSIALPGTNGFVGEFLILLGSFQSKVAHWGWVVIAGLGVIFGAIYMLHMVQKVCYRKPSSDKLESLKDFGWKEAVIYIPLVALIFVIGLYPEWILGPVRDKTALIFSTFSGVVR